MEESRGGLLKISPTMETLQIIDFNWNPTCVRINRTNGDFWTSGEFGLKKSIPRIMK